MDSRTQTQVLRLTWQVPHLPNYLLSPNSTLLRPQTPDSNEINNTGKVHCDERKGSLMEAVASLNL